MLLQIWKVKDITKFKYFPFLFLSLTLCPLATLATLLVSKLSRHIVTSWYLPLLGPLSGLASPDVHKVCSLNFPPGFSSSVISSEQRSLIILK